MLNSVPSTLHTKQAPEYVYNDSHTKDIVTYYIHITKDKPLPEFDFGERGTIINIWTAGHANLCRTFCFSLLETSLLSWNKAARGTLSEWGTLFAPQR